MMKRRSFRRAAALIGGVTALGVTAVAATSTGATAAPTGTAANSLVSAPGGQWLVDAQGRHLLLSGVDLVEKCSGNVQPQTTYPGTPCLPTGTAPTGTLPYLLSPTASDPGRRFTDADAQTLQNMGIDEVRLGVIWDGLEPGPAGAQANDPRWCTQLAPTANPQPLTGTATVYNAAVAQAYLNQVDVTVNLLAAHGIRSLIDMHQDAWGDAFGSLANHWNGVGAPLWATCTNNLPSVVTPTTFLSAYADPPTLAAFGHFWANDVSGNLQGEYARIWTVVANHFAGNPNILGYDAFNEPGDVTIATGTFGQKLQCTYDGTALALAACVASGSRYNPGLIPTIQAADPTHVVFVEPPITQDLGLPNSFGLGSLPFKNIGISFHDYGFSSGLTPGTVACTASACPAEEANSMNLSMLQRSTIQTLQPGGPASLLSEFGATSDVATDNRVANLADQNLISWTYWSGLQLHDPTGGPAEGLIDETTRQANSGMAAALARPHAAAVAGIPTAQSFDMTTGNYSASWIPDASVSAPTLIRVPVAYQYPHGYTVAVTGGAFTQSATGDVVSVTANSGSLSASVKITAKA